MALSRKAEAPVQVQVPGQAEDRPSWKRVGIIAAAGFVIGIGWPRLAGVRLGPSPPETAASASVSASASAAPAPPIAALPATSLAPTATPPTAASAPVPSAVTPAAGTAAPAAAPAPLAATAPSPAAPSPPEAPSSAGPAVVSVGSGSVFACKTSDGDSLKGPECGKLTGLDAIVVPKLRKLADCPEASSASGRLPLVVRLDFVHGWIAPELGRNATVASQDALLACAKADLAGATLANIAHENSRYSVSYAVTFGANGGASPSSAGDSPHSPVEAADATVQVVWEVALVRDVPKTGKVVARLPRGAQVRVGPVKDGWYPVKYGDGFVSDGWVYRGAIGR
jgi:hypothetical protein